MAKAKLVPLADRVIVGPADEKKSKTGIIIPANASKEKPVQGIVIAVGPGRINDAGTRLPLQVKVGDIVLFSKYGPEEITLDGVTYYVLREDQLLAIMK